MDEFARVGNDISHGLGSTLSRAFEAVDGSAARRELLALQQEFRRTADVEADAAARMIRDQRRLAEATAKYGDDSSKAAAANAVLARSQRDHVDAMVAAEAAHVRLTKAGGETANSVSRLQQLGSNPIFNAIGIGSVAAMGFGLVDFGKKAGDFQASQERLVASAGETTQNLKAVSDGILQLAGQVGYSAQDLMNNMYSVEKAGFRGADGVNVIKAAAQGAKSENAELGEVLNGLTTSMNDFGYKSDQAADVMSKMVAATSMAKTNFQDFSGSLHSAEPLIANIGKSQGLNGDQMHHLMADLYGLGAQMTQTGDSAQHAFQLIGHAASKLLGPTAAMRSMMGSLGLDAQDVTDHLGERGVTGTLQLLQQALQAHTKDGMVDLDVHYRSAQAARAEAQAFAALPGPAKAVAQQIKDGALSYKDFRKSRGGLNVEMANDVNQWNNLNNKLTGYNDLIKSGIGNHISYDQALKILTGDQETLQVALQAAGENTDAVNAKIQQVDQTTREHDGTVKGFNETQETLNAKMADAKAAFGAAAIEIGSAFVPVMTEVAKDAKWVGDELAKHPGIAHGVVTALEGLGGAWLAFKAIDIAGAILRPIASGLGTIIAEEEGAEAATSRLQGALSGLKTAGLLGLGAQLGGQWAQDHTQQGSFWHSAAVVGTDAGTGAATGAAIGSIIPGVGTGIGAGVGALIGGGIGIYNQVTSHAGGGPLHAPGPKGRDSALFWGADGEHVLTHHEVQKMGGHSGVYQFRSDLMNGNIVLGRQYGGALGPDVQAAESMAGTKYSQGSRTDCSGMVGRVVLGAMGLPATNLPTTQNMGQWLTALGFQNGIGGPGSISVGWYNHGSGANDGHAAMTLSDGENAESGGSHGNFIVGSGAAGAASSQFDHHMFLPTLYGEGSATGMPGGFGGGMGFGGGAIGGGGGIPAGARAGTGPGGQPGYYTAANPQRVASAEERLRHLDAEIANAEKRKTEMKATAKQSERDRLDEEIRHLKEERVQAQQRLTQAEQGTFHASRGGRGGGGSPFLPVPLAGQFGLSKGLPGLAEWAVGFLEDLVLGPMETAAWAAIGQAPPGAGGVGGGFGPAGLGFPNPGALGAPGAAPGADAGAGADLGGPSRGNEMVAASGGSSGTSSTPSSWSDPYWTKKAASPAAPAASPPPAPPQALYGPEGSGAKYRSPLQVPYGERPDYWADSYWGTRRLDAPGSGLTPQPGSAPPAPAPGMGVFEPPPGSEWMKHPNQHGLIPGIGPHPPQPEYHATGGPIGTDTVPAWLSPGEAVEQKSAVDKYGMPFMGALNQGLIDPSVVQYFDEGTPDGPVQPQPQNMVKTPGAPGGPSKQPPPGAPKPGQPAGPKPSGGGATSINDKGVAALTTPGADANQPGTGQPAQPGIGFSGGALGALEGAASQGASMGVDMVAPGAGQAAGAAMQIGFQEINRAAAYAAQDVGIGVEGLLEGLIPNAGGSSSDWSKTIPGRLLMGVTGVRPAGQQNTAGQTQQPFAPNSSGDQFASTGGNTQERAPIQILGPVHVKADDPNQFHESLNEHTNMAAATVGVDRTSQASYW
ncbi:phage tail tape measure protein [Mycobacterium intracellulare]|uniref:phage tail tape measure protein n=1 Tax=Mycobacterium intracellulare TaxID=1767 RepID=UPI0027E01C90|nr:phage tail tape measure protein [Mycobacterium intracellulare]